MGGGDIRKLEGCGGRLGNWRGVGEIRGVGGERLGMWRGGGRLGKWRGVGGD